jgi:hypothetical protein
LSLKDNEEMARKEEPTRAPTPDKLDRSARSVKTSVGKRPKPYPLTEEEATPNTPDSERSSKPPSSRRDSHVAKTKTKKQVKTKTSSDYNEHVSHPRPR